MGHVLLSHVPSAQLLALPRHHLYHVWQFSSPVFLFFNLLQHVQSLTVLYCIDSDPIYRFLSAGLAFVENHERFPTLADRVKINFGFMFSAKGKASYILRCVWTSGSLACCEG